MKICIKQDLSLEIGKEDGCFKVVEVEEYEKNKIIWRGEGKEKLEYLTLVVSHDIKG
ncbi:hypothetical protein [Sulfurisphaera ohwakuensis]|uniref:Uncharacterized protein n=1 Tax=Sulfurisphaera ohwakuensis TaxID=69656 RepID=A0A7J9RUE3_SULOH|nr:hypothetical protein [Sulfurisphaera ohwakuensis]MBB5254607.1 hypothetical protein [Sulfurisphaera ohwakuensis]